MNPVFREMTCSEARSRLDPYLSGELADGSAAALAGHLESCRECAAEYDARRRTRLLLRRAVASQAVRPGLEDAIRARLREMPEPRRTALFHFRVPWPALAAAAAVVLLAVIGGWRLQSLREAPELASARDLITAILHVGMGDHVHCAVYRKYPKPPSREEMAEKMGPEFAPLVQVVAGRMPDRRVMLAHKCTFHGREFVHLVLNREGSILSVILTRKRPGDEDGLLRNVGFLRVQGLEISGFETSQYFVYVAAEEAGHETARLAGALKAPVAEFLARLAA